MKAGNRSCEEKRMTLMFLAQTARNDGTLNKIRNLGKRTHFYFSFVLLCFFFPFAFREKNSKWTT